MPTRHNLLTSRWGPILTGIAVGVLAPVLVALGNPGNMGVCVACFSRDIAGALGLHRAAAVQYIRPEIVGFVLGSLAAALMFREFKPRTGSAPVVRFLLGMLSMIGALVFLGCPWRAYLRLSAGDGNAILGILGLAAGIGLGIVFLRMGFGLGRNRPAPRALGWVMPGVMIRPLAPAPVRAAVRPKSGRDGDRPHLLLRPGARKPTRADPHLTRHRTFRGFSGPAQSLLHRGGHPGSDPSERFAPVQRRTRASRRGLLHESCPWPIQTRLPGAAHRAHQRPVELRRDGTVWTRLHSGRWLPRAAALPRRRG